MRNSAVNNLFQKDNFPIAHLLHTTEDEKTRALSTVNSLPPLSNAQKITETGWMRKGITQLEKWPLSTRYQRYPKTGILVLA